MFKFASYNLWYGKEWEKEIRFLKKENVDIFVLQEVTKNIPEFGLENTDVFQEFKQAFPRHEGVYAPITHKKERGRKVGFGNAIFSRFPIVSSEAHYLLKPLDWTDDYKNMSRNLLEAKIRIENKEIYIFTTHLTYSPGFIDTPNKIKEAKTISKIIRGKEPFIFAGDFNSHPDTEVIKILSQVASYLNQSNKPTWTKHPFSYEGFSETELKWKLDYVFASDDLKCTEYKIVDINYSDHLPIIVNFQIR